jgi:cyclopropane-fatty-acyl-phospholipid synthase
VKDSVDFIQKYIFPGGALPSVHEIMTSVKKVTELQLSNLKDITFDYAKTLRDWRIRFNSKKEEVLKQGYDETFIRMWNYYLCYCHRGNS